MIGVVGAGAFGTALAVSLGRTGQDLLLWGRDAAAMERAGRTREIARLPGVALPRTVSPTADLDRLAACDTLILAVPAQQLTDLLARIAHLPARHLVAACKGVDLKSLRGPAATIAAGHPDATAAILSGPSFAADIARSLPTALSLACADETAGQGLQAALSTPTLRLYRTTDVTGVELGGALKNVVAIACGAAIGAALGDSARAALMTRGMAEMTRLATALGARPETLMGLSGLGDLVLTCGSPQSRNFALGHALGAGTVAPDATTEGVATAEAALRLAARYGIDLPVTRATADLVAGRVKVKDAMRALLDRDLKQE